MRRLAVLSVCCALLLGAYLSRELPLPAVAKWLNVGERPRPCDYVVPLPGGPQTRPFVAAAIVNAGLAREALVIQTITSPETEDRLIPPDHELVHSVLVHRGVAPARIRLLRGQSDSTFNDAEAVKRFLAAQDVSTVAIVTNSNHTRRARWIFEQVLGHTGHQFYFVSAPDDQYDEDHWWQTRAGLAMYLGEYAKLAYYHFRYATGWTLLVCAIPAAIALFVLRAACTRRRSHVSSIVQPRPVGVC